MTKSQAAIRELTRAMFDRTGNLPPLPGIYPDYFAPIVRNGADGARGLVVARGGMPSSQRALLDATKKRARKLEANGKPYAFNELLRMEPDSGTTNIRNVPIHAKAMPVILTTEAEREAWMTAPAAEALKVQRPLPMERSRSWQRVKKRTRSRRRLESTDVLNERPTDARSLARPT